MVLEQLPDHFEEDLNWIQWALKEVIRSRSRGVSPPSGRPPSGAPSYRAPLGLYRTSDVPERSYSTMDWDNYKECTYVGTSNGLC